MSGKRSTCKGCGNEIYWALVLPTNKKMPVDLFPVDDGNIIWVDGKHVRVLKAHEIGLEQHRNKRYLGHWVSCSKADQFRKKAVAPDPEPNLFDQSDPPDPLAPTKEW